MMAVTPTAVATLGIVSSWSRTSPPPCLNHFYKSHPQIFTTIKNKKSSRKHTERVATVRATVSVDQQYDRKLFDDTKDGVKGLVASGLKSIPPFFVHPSETLSKYKLPETRPDPDLVPVIDFSGVDSDRKKTITELITQASKDIGLFQITNHGIPLELMEKTVAAVRAFHEQPAEMKAPYYHRDMSRGASYYSNVDLFDCVAASWGDTLRVMGPPRPEVIPPICRNEVVECHRQITRLAELLMAMLCEGLGVKAAKWKHLTALEAWTIVGLYYPPCPQPELTVGQLAHTDPGFFTVLLQDQVGGLQVKYGDQWVDVKPIPGAVAVNVGDIFQMMSNGAYISADHRVLPNRANEARVSTAFFFRPSNKESVYGPFEELISPENPPLYKQFTIPDFVMRFVTQSFDGKGNVLGYYKI